MYEREKETMCYMASVIVAPELSFFQLGRRLPCDNG